MEKSRGLSAGGDSRTSVRVRRGDTPGDGGGTIVKFAGTARGRSRIFSADSFRAGTVPALSLLSGDFRHRICYLLALQYVDAGEESLELLSAVRTFSWDLHDVVRRIHCGFSADSASFRETGTSAGIYGFPVRFDHPFSFSFRPGGLFDPFDPEMDPEYQTLRREPFRRS